LVLESGLGPVLALGLELEPALGQVLALGLELELGPDSQ
jgi:hypothetical protein